MREHGDSEAMLLIAYEAATAQERPMDVQYASAGAVELGITKTSFPPAPALALAERQANRPNFLSLPQRTQFVENTRPIWRPSAGPRPPEYALYGWKSGHYRSTNVEAVGM